MENLMFFYEQAHAQKVTPVAVTVPSLRDDSGQGYSDETSQSGQGLTGAVEQAIALRLMLNQSIKELGHAQQFPVVDWFTATCESPAQALAAEFSNDGLHLNTAGYRKLAELVCSQVLEDLLSKQN